LKLATTHATRSDDASLQLDRSLSVEHRHGGVQPSGGGVGGDRSGQPARSPPARSGSLANVDDVTPVVLFAAPPDAAYATGTEFVSDSGYVLAPVDATSGPPLHHAAVVILPGRAAPDPPARESGYDPDNAFSVNQNIPPA
jgi:hypothetical protein